MAAVWFALATGALGTEYFVATNGSDNLAGTNLATAFRTVQHAADLSSTGDTIWVRGGTYREYVRFARGGSPEDRLQLKGYTNEFPEITGSDLVTGWTLLTNSIWKTTNWPLNSQQVFVDQVPLRMVGYPNDYMAVDTSVYIPFGFGFPDMTNGTFFYDRTNLTLLVWLADGSSPTTHTVEVSTRNQIINVARGTRGFRLENMAFRRCSSAGNDVYGQAGVRIGSNSVVSHCAIEWCDAAAMSVPAHSRIEHSEISHNGFVGLGWASVTDAHIVACRIMSNNYRGFNEYWHAGGIKVIPIQDERGGGTAGGLIESNEVAGNHGHAVWFDSCTGRVPKVIRNNYIHDNRPFPGHGGVSPAGVLIEITKGAEVYNNIIVSNEGMGCWIGGSDNVRVHHNVFAGNGGYADIRVADIPRQTSPAFDIWASLVSNEVFNNIIVDSTCLFTLTMPTNNSDPTAFAQGNRSDGNVFYSATNYYRFAIMGGLNWTTFVQWKTGTVWDAASTNADPLLGAGYRPAAGSPAVDRGVTSSMAVADYDGIARPLDGNNDGIARSGRGDVRVHSSPGRQRRRRIARYERTVHWNKPREGGFG